MPGCCCLNETGNNVLLKINWRWVNQGFHAAFLRGISTATTTLSEPMQTLMLHLFTPPAKTLCGQLLVGHCAQLYNRVFIVTPTAQCTDLLGVSGGNSTKFPEEIPLTLRRNVWFQHDGTADHSSRQVREHLTATYNDCWIG
jgi:hypothetical protein